MKEYFDPNLPTVSDVKDRYKNPLDLRKYESLTHENVANAILSGDRRGLIIPDEPGKYQIWDRSDSVKSKGRILPLNSALRFKRYGPQIDVTTSNTSQRDIRERHLTPRMAFREKLSDPEVRKKLLEGAYRGIGWWDPRTRTHNIAAFDVFPEAYFYEKFYKNDMGFKYLFSDGYVHTPSVSGEPEYRVTLRVFPNTDDFLIEWLMTQAYCECLDQFHRGARGKKKGRDEFENIFKYSKPERVWCKHTLGALRKAEKLSHKWDNVPDFRVSSPEPTGILNPFYTIKTKTLIAVRNSFRRPIKLEDGILLGNVTGYAGPEEMFDLTE